MSTTFKNLTDAFQQEGTNLGNALKLIPSALKEISKIKANGNQMGFEKVNGLWYADFENWPFAKTHLLMVQGADDLIEELANGKEYVTLKISQHSKKVTATQNEAILQLKQKDRNGLSGTYNVLGAYETQQIWLCPVINFIFFKVPKFIKFSKVA